MRSLDTYVPVNVPSAFSARALLAFILALCLAGIHVARAQQPSPSGAGAPAEVAPEDIPTAPRAVDPPPGSGSPSIETTPAEPSPAPAPSQNPAPSPTAPPAPNPAGPHPAPAPGKSIKPARVEIKRASEARIGHDGQANDPSKPVQVRVVSPHHGEVMPTNTVEVLFEVENYTMAEYGNRLHIIVDNEPPVPWHDVSKPLVLNNLAEGGHLIRVMATKPDGRALPNKEAFTSVSFYVVRKNFLNFVVPNSPVLTVNLPIDGVQDVDDTSTIWLDFTTQNAPIGKGYMLRYRINSQEEFVTDDKPSFWTGLKPGRYELIAELVDTSKRPVPGIFNRVTRIFDLRATQKASAVTPEEAAAAAPVRKKAEPMD